MFTIDVNCLIRQWDLRTGKCYRSYPLEISADPSQEDDSIA